MLNLAGKPSRPHPSKASVLVDENGRGTTAATCAAAGESGFVLIAMLILVVPLVLLVGTFSGTMMTRNSGLQTELDREIALLAAESGTDDVLHLLRHGSWPSGVSTHYSRALGFGQQFEVTTLRLGADGHDNDGDGMSDEADENMLEVTITGIYRGLRRRLVTYLGWVPTLPSVGAAVTLLDPGVVLELDGNSLFSGFDQALDGTAGAGPDIAGAGTAPPGTVVHLVSECSPTEAPTIVGTGGAAPSLATVAAVEIEDLVGQFQHAARNVLTTAQFAGVELTGAGGTENAITLRDGDLALGGRVRGAGVLVVTGDLSLTGDFRFHGLVIVLGAIRVPSGSAQIWGALVHGPSGGLIDVDGTFEVHYSTSALAAADADRGRAVSFNGWHEVAAPR